MRATARFKQGLASRDCNIYVFYLMLMNPEQIIPDRQNLMLPA
jgi:hypothetical protein